jgi:amidase
MPGIAKDYGTIAAAKKEQLQSRIPKEWLLPMERYYGISNLLNVPLTSGILDDVECNITSNYDATGLLGKLRSGVWSAERVTIAFCKRAAIAQQLVCQPKLHISKLLLISSNCIDSATV